MSFNPTTQHATFAVSLTKAGEALRANRFEQVLVLLEPWTREAQPHPAALQLTGIALAQLGQIERAADCQQRLVQLAPHDLSAWVNFANTQLALGRLAQALESLDKALQLDPSQPAVHFNRGNVLMRQGAYEAASESFRRAAELALDRPDPLCNQASALNALRRHGEALELLRGVVARFPDLAAGWNLLGSTWHRLEKDAQALECYQRALQCDPGLLDAYTNGAQILARLRRFDEALAMAWQAAERAPENAVAFRTVGEILLGADKDEEARPWLERAHQLAPQDPLTLCLLLKLDSTGCDWESGERRLAMLRDRWKQGSVDGLEPWRLLSHALDGDELRVVTEMVSAKRFGRPVGAQTATAWPAVHGRARPERLRIGYFSADLHQHPVSVLVAGMLEHHDRSRFETVAFCMGRYETEPVDPMRPRLRAAFDRFERVQHLGDEEAVHLAREMDIHIAVDLTGHTLGGRPGIFVRRAAPVQMHYIGYPGTLGMPGAFDYLVADPIVVPPQAHRFYSEKIIALPDSYQANDRERRIDTAVQPREALGLPADAFVFCCFNQQSKITRDVFALWMDLLLQRPGSVLWLLAGDARAERNLRAAAVERGVAPERLVFAPRAPLAQHLARHAHADLFLDTWPYNAHTTASDALWAGVPVLTCAGQTFASRVGASLLHACGLPQLVTYDASSFLARALELSAAPEALQALRRQLADTRLQVPLFDTERITRHIESAYDLAWERHRQGLAPEHFSVPPLS